MLALGIILLVISLFSSIFGFVLVFDQFIQDNEFVSYLMAFGGLLLFIVSIILIVKSYQFEELLSTIQSNKEKRRFKKFIKKYQAKEHFTNPNRKDLALYYSTKSRQIIYLASLCDIFKIDHPNSYYRLLNKDDKLAIMYNAMENVYYSKGGYFYTTSLNQLKEYAENGDPSANYKLYVIFNKGVETNEVLYTIKPDKKLAMKYLNRALDKGYIGAYEALIYDAYDNNDFAKVEELLKKYELKGTSIYYQMYALDYYYGIKGAIDYQKALNLFKKCDLTLFKVNAMAYCYIQLKQYDNALQIYKDLYEIGNIDGLTNYCTLLDTRFGQQAKAFKITYKAYKTHKNNDSLTFRLAHLYEKGIGCKKNISKAIELYKILVKKNSATAINNLAAIYSKYNISTKQEVFNLYLKAANLNESRALANVGHCYQYGIGVKVDYKLAYEYYKKAADLNDQKAIHQLATLYLKGIYVKKDVNKAKELFLKNSEFDASLYSLAYIYFDEKDYNSADRVFKQFIDSIKQKNIYVDYKEEYKIAHFEIGYMAYNKAQYQKAMKYYRISADLGDPIAMHNIGVLYQDGKGVTRNLDTAKEWFDKAKRNGFKAK